jgi:hypothetical protein
VLVERQQTNEPFACVMSSRAMNESEVSNDCDCDLKSFSNGVVANLLQIQRAVVIEQLLSNVAGNLTIIRNKLASSCSQFIITTTLFVLQVLFENLDLLLLLLLI